MGGDNQRPAPRDKQPVELLYRPDYVRHVLDNMNRPELLKRAVAERVRELVEIRNYVRVRIRISIQTDSAWILINSAADV